MESLEDFTNDGLDPWDQKLITEDKKREILEVPLRASISIDMPSYSIPSYSTSGYSMDVE